MNSIQLSRQLVEAGSWRVATELARRVADRVVILETHPGGGLYDCLSIHARSDLWSGGHIDLNRLGRAHIHRRFDGLAAEPVEVDGVWELLAAADDPMVVVDRIARTAGLPVGRRPPRTSQTTLVYRIAAAFLAQAVYGRRFWECRNGYLDSSGVSTGVRRDWFDVFPVAEDRRRCNEPGDPGNEPAYRFWFLVSDDRPRLCLETTGSVWSESGREWDLMATYRDHGRRIWPVIGAVAGDLLD